MVFLLSRIGLVAKCGSRCLLMSQTSLPAVSQTATISGKAMRDRTYQKPPPFPYKEKHLRLLSGLFQNPLRWFDENTKLIVVEGSIAAGKSEFAKKLADELEMLYMPEVSVNDMYVNEYGFDLRELNSQMPETCKLFDVKAFYEKPHHMNVAKFQLQMYKSRYSQHIDALCHILNTGQGVVLERCVYSDCVFMETMVKHNYLSSGVKSYYEEVKVNTITELMRPHLVIYLDVPPNILLERIQKRGIEHEVKSNVITKEYLETLETEYKDYLKYISKHAELLVYDWSNYGDIEVVVEDIERLDFDQYDKFSKKLEDWRLFDYWDWVDKRYTYTTQKHFLMTYFHVPRWDVPEILMDSQEAPKYWELIANAPGQKYTRGYNVDMGDTGLLFKIKRAPRHPC